MKHFIFLAAALLLISSCRKDDSGKETPEPEGSYLNTAAGSTWSYREVNRSDGVPDETIYMIGSTSKSSVINGKKYHVYNLSYGGNKFMLQSRNDYYEYDLLAGDLTDAIERLYLKTNVAVNGSWSQEAPILVPGTPISIMLKINNQILSKGSRTVSGVTYSDVIHVKTTLTSTDIPADKFKTDINSYYAKGIGLIENTSMVNLNYMGVIENIDMQTTLISSDLK